MGYGKYILGGPDGHTVIPVEDALEWAKVFEEKARIVKQEEVEHPSGLPIWVSTVFLGLDHRFGDGGPPIVFESMAFMPSQEKWMPIRNKYMALRTDLACERYCTWEEAEAGHLAMVEKVLSGEIEIEPYGPEPEGVPMDLKDMLPKDNPPAKQEEPSPDPDAFLIVPRSHRAINLDEDDNA